jgi:putative ABC transport system ATP-binding protein
MWAKRNCTIVIANKPTGNLDATMGQTMIDLLFAFRRECGTLLVIISHDLALAERCDRWISLRAGEIEQEATAPNVSL